MPALSQMNVFWCELIPEQQRQKIPEATDTTMSLLDRHDLQVHLARTKVTAVKHRLWFETAQGHKEGDLPNGDAQAWQHHVVGDKSGASCV